LYIGAPSEKSAVLGQDLTPSGEDFADVDAWRLRQQVLMTFLGRRVMYTVDWEYEFEYTLPYKFLLDSGTET